MSEHNYTTNYVANLRHQFEGMVEIPNMYNDDKKQLESNQPTTLPLSYQYPNWPNTSNLNICLQINSGLLSAKE